MKAPKRILVVLGLTAGLAGLLPGCKTVDIDPLASIGLDSASAGRLAENGGTVAVTVNLNGASKQDVQVTLAFGGTAQQGVDYAVEGSALTVPAGSTSATLTLTGINDDLVEGDETILVTIASAGNATVDAAGSLTIVISDDDKDSDGDGLSDSDDNCPHDAGPAANHGCPAGFGLIFNEVLYDPSDATVAAGDANGDGHYDQTEDEFIELYNNTGAPIDLSGVTVSDTVLASQASTVRYTFPAGTSLPPHKAFVVFGGGTPTGGFGGSQVLVVGGLGLSLGNTGEQIVVKSPAGSVLLNFDSDALSNNPNESYTRNPDITGIFAQHSDAVTGVLFSPGTRIDGTNF